LRLAVVRARLGQAAPDEVSALTAQAELTRAGLPLLRKQLQQTEHLLAVLAGRPPARGVPAFMLADFSLPEHGCPCRCHPNGHAGGPTSRQPKRRCALPMVNWCVPMRASTPSST
jgi:hypothetical protein